MVRSPWLVPLLLVLAGCPAAARHIRQAQDAFSEAAATENATRDDPDDGLIESTSVAQSYRLSLSLVDRELADNREELAADRLLGTALMLKAMCHWRLCDLDDSGDPDVAGSHAERMANVLASIAESRDALVLGPRDDAMRHALPGLRDHDRGRRAADYGSAKSLFVSAITLVDGAVDQAPPRHPVRIYLGLAQLASCREWHAAVYALLDSERNAAATEVADHAVRVAEKLKQGWPRNETVQSAVLSFMAALGIDASTIPSFSW